MKLKDLKDELRDEVGTILGREFSINVIETKSVPHSADAAITFPNLDAKEQGAKLIDTCVLYIDIRRSTELSLTHKPTTVAKLYSAFVRAMTKCARHYNGHVRGIIGDRVMVIFDTGDAFKNAVNTAVLMNSTAQYVINKYFTRNEVACGIGIDAGKMLATKTGFRRQGYEQNNYKNLVWLGRPANIASKLTDLANKPAENLDAVIVHAHYNLPFQSQWIEEWPHFFVQNLEMDYMTNSLRHKNPLFDNYFTGNKILPYKRATPAILMTEIVYDQFKKVCPNDNIVTKKLFRQIELVVSGYRGKVFGGDVIFTAFQEDF